MIHLTATDLISITGTKDYKVLSKTISIDQPPIVDPDTGEETPVDPITFTYLDAAEVNAISLIKSILSHRFDVDAGLIARDPLLIRSLLDLTLYDAYTTAEPLSIPDVRVKRYDDSIGILKGIAKGSMNTQIPLLVTEETPSPAARIIISDDTSGQGMPDLKMI